MGYAKMRCPSCGADVEPSGSGDFFFCTFCGTKIVKDKKYVELSGAVSVDGLASENALLERAFLFLEDGDFDRADEYLEKVLDINPRRAKAYIGKLMCQTGRRKPEELVTLRLPLPNYGNFNKAVRFSAPDEAKEYGKLEKAVAEAIAAEKRGMESTISELEAGIISDEEYLESQKSKQIMRVAKKYLMDLLIVISVLATIVFLAGLSTSPFFAIPAVLCAVCLFFIIRGKFKADKATVVYDNIKNTLPQKRASLQNKQADLQDWLQNKREFVPAD